MQAFIISDNDPISAKVREALLREAHDCLAALAGLRAAGHARVMVVGPAGDSRLVLQAVRTGAGDYLDEAELDGELQAALGRLRAELGTQAEPARTIALLAPSGGCGSST